MNALGPGAVLDELQVAAGERQRDALRRLQPAGVEAEQAAAGERARERADHAGWVEALRVEAALRHARDARAGLHGGDIRGQQLGAAVPALAGQRQHRGQDADGEVHDAGHVRVVVVEAVHEHAVEQRRVAHRQPAVEADHRRAAAGMPAGERLHRVGAARGEVLAARGERTADGVEQQVAGAQADGGGHVLQPQAMHEAGEAAGDGIGAAGDCFLGTVVHDARLSLQSALAPESLTAFVHLAISDFT